LDLAARQVQADVVHLHDQRHHAIDAMVSSTPTTARAAGLDGQGLSATSARAMAMISPDRIRSVRIAPSTFCFSSSGPPAPVPRGLALDHPGVKASRIFSVASKAR
jgi:hypothetical protein